MGSRADSGGAVDRHACITSLRLKGFAGVQTRSDAYQDAIRPGMGGDRTLRGNRSAHSVTCPMERIEERIALGIDFTTTMRPKGGAQEPTVIFQDLQVLLTEVLEKSR